MELLQAFTAVADRFTEHQLVIAGDGAMRDLMMQSIQKQGIADRVVLLGNVMHKELPALMQYASLVVLPSYHEGVPNVLLESMAAGTPVVATAVGGIPEIVEQDVTGILVPSAEPVMLAEALKQALQKPWQRSAIQQHAAQFTWQKNKAQMLEMLG